MKRYRAEKSVVADGVPLAAGDVFDEDEVPAGTLACMLRTGQAVEVADVDLTLDADDPAPDFDLTLDEEPGPAFEADPNDPDNRPEPGDDSDGGHDPDEEPGDDGEKPRRLGRGRKPKIGREKH